jgi:hypothetical protein
LLDPVFSTFSIHAPVGNSDIHAQGFSSLKLPIQVMMYMMCSKSFGTFEIACQLSILAMLGKLCYLVVCFLIIFLCAASSCCD